MGEEGVQIIPINTIKEMEKKGWIGFSQGKNGSLSSYTMIGFP